jgi:hypothetical protein
MSIIKNRKVWTVAMICGMLLLTACIGSVSGSPQLPCEFYGTVTINGAPAPSGTIITAYVNSVKQGSITVKDTGKYGGVGTFDERLIVLSGENDFSGGAPSITFKIGDKTADQTAPYSPGMSSELALSSGGGIISTPAAAVQSPSPVGSDPVQMMSTEMSASSNPALGTDSPIAALITLPPVTSPVVPVQTVVPASPVVNQSSGENNSILSITSAPESQNPAAAPVVTPVVAQILTQVPTNISTVVPPAAAPGVNVTLAPSVVVPVATQSSVSVTPVPVVPATIIDIPTNQTIVNGTSSTNLTNPVINASGPVENVGVTVSFPSGQIITP